MACALLFALGGPLFAEDSPEALATPDPIRPSEAQPAKEPDKRVFGLLPNYRTAEETGTYVPITSHQKLTIATKDTVDYPLFLFGAGFAGLAQLSGQHAGFGQGVKGYAHRYATAYADQAIGNYLTEGLLPSLFHEDPRYFRRGSGRGGVWSRTGYAASRIVVTRTDSGRTRFNFVEVAGNGISAGIANAYYPSERGFNDNFQRLYVALATDAVSQILREFWPDVKRKFFTPHRNDPH